MKKKMFTILETKTVTEEIYYEVEADSVEEAIEKVKDGDVEETENFYDDIDIDSEYKCINQYEK
jgi:phosphoenolpyruvate carboxylase